jgi:hypothetical protein
MTCEFAENVTFLEKGRICKLDGLVCHNFEDDNVVKQCPSLNAFRNGEPVGKIVCMDYKGIPKCFRSGKFGTFDGGMPPEYLNKREKGR